MASSRVAVVDSELNSSPSCALRNCDARQHLHSQHEGLSEELTNVRHSQSCRMKSSCMKKSGLLECCCVAFPCNPRSHHWLSDFGLMINSDLIPKLLLVWKTCMPLLFPNIFLFNLDLFWPKTITSQVAFNLNEFANGWIWLAFEKQQRIIFQPTYMMFDTCQMLSDQLRTCFEVGAAGTLWAPGRSSHPQHRQLQWRMLVKKCWAADALSTTTSSRMLEE